MSGRGHRGGLGFGGAVGLGVAAALLIGVIAIGHAIFGQLKGAALVVLVFAEVAACVILGAVALGVLGLVAYRGQLARYHLAEQRLGLEQLARQLGTVRAEVISGGEGHTEALEGDGEALSHKSARPAILGKRPITATSRHLEAVPEPSDTDGT
jgi:hypothetical protein